MSVTHTKPARTPWPYSWLPTTLVFRDTRVFSQTELALRDSLTPLLPSHVTFSPAHPAWSLPVLTRSLTHPHSLRSLALGTPRPPNPWSDLVLHSQPRTHPFTHRTESHHPGKSWKGVQEEDRTYCPGQAQGTARQANWPANYLHATDPFYSFYFTTLVPLKHLNPSFVSSLVLPLNIP